MRAPSGQVAVAVGVVAIGALILGGSFFLPRAAVTRRSARASCRASSASFLLVAGGFLLREALTGGFRGVDEEAELHLPMNWVYFAWASGGIIAYGLIVEHLGFIVASTVLFVMVARSFESTRWGPQRRRGCRAGCVIFAIFNYGLGLMLPLGIFQKLVS
jgi:putative tricarboxylic transport membrane protein